MNQLNMRAGSFGKLLMPLGLYACVSVVHAVVVLPVGRCVEVASPKQGRGASHGRGLEHAEVVIGESTHSALHSQSVIHAFMQLHPGHKKYLFILLYFYLLSIY